VAQRATVCERRSREPSERFAVRVDGTREDSNQGGASLRPWFESEPAHTGTLPTESLRTAMSAACRANSYSGAQVERATILHTYQCVKLCGDTDQQL